jgi:hypothetical protein
MIFLFCVFPLQFLYAERMNEHKDTKDSKPHQIVASNESLLSICTEILKSGQFRCTRLLCERADSICTVVVMLHASWGRPRPVFPLTNSFSL